MANTKTVTLTAAHGGGTITISGQATDNAATPPQGTHGR
jgi:hypothetical protein